MVWILRFINGTHGLNCKNIVRNSSRNRKIDLPSIRHSFYKIIRVVSSNSDEENSFPRNIKKKKHLCGCLQRLFQTHSKTSALRLNTDELFLHVGKYMPLFRRKLQRNLRIKFWKSDVLASLTSSDRVSLLPCSQDSDSLIRHATAISLFPFYWARLLSVCIWNGAV